MTIGYLFSGQGQQFAGMGADLYAQEASYRDVIDQASDILHHDLTTPAVVEDPQLAQANIVAFSVALHRVLAPELPAPAAMTGLSLGEYSALVAADSLDLATILPLVVDRTAYMNEAGTQRPGTMSAVLKTSAEQVEAICHQVREQGELVYPANYNTARQIVIGGSATGVAQATERFHAAGIKRVVPLNMTVASHTPLMAAASRSLARRLQDVVFEEPSVAVYSNTTARPFAQLSLRDTLVKQLVQPTRFDLCLTALCDQGCDTLIEIGPGDALSKLAHKNHPDLTTAHVDSVATLNQVRHALEEVHG